MVFLRLAGKTDINMVGEFLATYVQEAVHNKRLANFPGDIEGMFIEINLKKQNGYFCNPPSQSDQYSFNNV